MKTDFKPRHIRELNRELEFERKGKLIFRTVSALILSIMVVGPTVLLLVLNAEWIDQAFSKWWVQFAFFVLIVLLTSYFYIRWKINR